MTLEEALRDRDPVVVLAVMRLVADGRWDKYVSLVRHEYTTRKWDYSESYKFLRNDASYLVWLVAFEIVIGGKAYD